MPPLSFCPRNHPQDGEPLLAPNPSRPRTRHLCLGLGGVLLGLAIATATSTSHYAVPTARPIAQTALTTVTPAHLSRRALVPLLSAPVKDPPASTTSVPVPAFSATEAELTDPDAFRATAVHKGWCAAHAALVLLALARGISGIHTTGQASAGLVAFVAAYILSDLGTGIFHWSVDNYGDKNTPMLGSVIDSFQGHHKYPWTITKRDWQNNVHMVAKPVTYPTALVALLPLAPPAHIFLATFSALVVYSQQFHAWSHMLGRELPPIVLALQDAGVLVSRRGHGQHHKPPFEGNYCIVSGLWNGVLDRGGFFKNLERLVEGVTGVAPRCWSVPTWKVQEVAPEGWDKKKEKALPSQQ